MGSPRGLREAADDDEDDPLSVMALGLGLARSLQLKPFDVVRSMKKEEKKVEEKKKKREMETDEVEVALGLAAPVVVFTLTVVDLASLVFPVVFLGALRVSVAFFLGATFKSFVFHHHHQRRRPW